MLACIPHTMSRKRNAPFNQSDVQPSTKRSRSQYETSGLAGYSSSSSNGSDNRQSLDVVVLSRPSRSRRVASVKAQIANTSIFIAEHRRSRSPSLHENTEEDGAVAVDGLWETSLPPNPGTDRLQKLEIKREGASCSSLSPLSSLGSEWEDEKVGDRFAKVPAPPKIKTPVLNLVPVTELRKSPEKRRAKKSTEPPPKLNGYVRRMASLNARACVSAMMESTRRQRKQKQVPSDSAEPPSGCVHDPSEHLSSPQCTVSPGSSPQSGAMMTHLQQTSSEKEEVDDESVTALSSSERYVLLCASPNTLTACGIIHGSDCSEASSVNTEGLLWNGDTIHPQSRVYLTTEGTMPRLIVPPVCPARPSRVQETISLARTLQLKQRKKRRAAKGDNGWCVLGSPIKEVLLLQEDGSKVTRTYYAGIRRKKEELWVRDCITVRSGKRKQDRPYIAKIGSIWKEDTTGCVMVTLFWYYRPEEASGMQSTDFQTDELLASQHYDDNSVACIEHKCYVLGIRPYCRYRAQCKSVAEGIGNLDSYSVVQRDPNEMGQLGLDSRSTKPCQVFLCHRGYNHIAGKLLKSHKH